MTLLLAVALLVLAAPIKGHSCSCCVSLADFTLSHPRSLEIALATRAAIEKGLVPDETRWISTRVLGEDGELVAIRKLSARRLVEAWMKGRGFTDSAGPMTVHFLFISSRESCGIELRQGEVLFQAKPSPRCDARVLTTKETLAAMLEGRMSLATARELGLLVVEGERAASGCLLR